MDKLLSILKPQEITNLKLRYLYESLGYKEYKMSSFEEYRFYLESSSYMFRNAVITFTDLDGRLLALKPDVTPSIAKHADGSELKVYYQENVYRPDRNKRSFKEIGQIGLEYMGQIEQAAVAEVVAIAAKSLKLIAADSLLEIGHCGFVDGLLELCNGDIGVRSELQRLIAQKNVSSIEKLCVEAGIIKAHTDLLMAIPSLCGDSDEVIVRAKELCLTAKMNDAVKEIETICQSVKAASEICKVRVDLSLIGEEEYYNGITFCGYINGIASRVLSGGRYDPLLEKLGKKCGAVGFALYFDELEQFYYEDRSDT